MSRESAQPGSGCLSSQLGRVLATHPSNDPLFQLNPQISPPSNGTHCISHRSHVGRLDPRLASGRQLAFQGVGGEPLFRKTPDHHDHEADDEEDKPCLPSLGEAASVLMLSPLKEGNTSGHVGKSINPGRNIPVKKKDFFSNAETRVRLNIFYCIMCWDGICEAFN